MSLSLNILVMHRFQDALQCYKTSVCVCVCACMYVYILGWEISMLFVSVFIIITSLHRMSHHFMGYFLTFAQNFELFWFTSIYETI